MAKILLVEDDKAFADIAADWLARKNHIVEICVEGNAALELLKSFSFDVLILDWQLPGMSGPEICRAYRIAGGESPVIMLTGQGEIEDKTKGFDAGADDYLTKPCDLRELSMRVSALLRRPASLHSDVLQYQHLCLNVDSRIVQVSGKPVELQPKETALLEFFMRHPDRVFSQDAIIENVWTTSADVGTETVRTWIKSLRKKIDISEVSVIQTIYGVGYKLRSPE